MNEMRKAKNIMKYSVDILDTQQQFKIENRKKLVKYLLFVFYKEL